jgi:hypothetical protein
MGAPFIFNSLSRPEKLSHAPTKKPTSHEKTSGQKQQTKHTHSACDIGTICDPLQKGVYSLGNGVILFFHR